MEAVAVVCDSPVMPFSNHAAPAPSLGVNWGPLVVVALCLGCWAALIYALLELT